MDLERFTVEVPEAILGDLAERLARARWPEALDGPGWEDGTSPAFLRELVGWWQTGYDWRAQEAAINQFPQFQATVDGVRLHFVQVQGKGSAPLPLVLTHGWPSSFYELLPLVGLLTDPASHGGDPDDAFDVVIPSLPGYGFSDPRPFAYGLADRPVGLAAWILDKWREWSDCGGDPERRFTKDQLLTTVMLYWVTGTIGSSFRVYRDWALGMQDRPETWRLPGRDRVPAGSSQGRCRPACSFRFR